MPVVRMMKFCFGGKTAAVCGRVTITVDAICMVTELIHCQCVL